MQGPFDGPNARSSDHGDATNGIFAVDCQSRILAWNNGVEALLGRTAEDAIGQKCYDVMGGRLLSGKRVCCADCTVKQRARRKASLRDFDLVVKDGRGQHHVLTVSTITLPTAGAACTVHLVRRASSCLERGTMLPAFANTGLSNVTRREFDVLRALTKGSSTSEIAGQLFISPLTVRTHIRNLLRKHNLRNRMQLAVFALKNGLS